MPAYNQTRLQIVNAVLSRLREATVATTSTTLYSTFISTLLNTVRTQIEQAWQWRDLRDTYTLTVNPGTTSYSLTSSGQFAQIQDVWNRTTNKEVARGTTRGFNQKFFGVTTVERGDVTEFNPVGLDANYDVQIDTWPNVNSTNSLRVNLYIPQQDPTADSTVIVCPNQILIEGMVGYAMAERGDDNGVAVQAQMDLYREMLAGAIAGEIGQDQSEADWAPV